jgi:hypothetical protein
MMNVVRQTVTASLLVSAKKHNTDAGLMIHIASQNVSNEKKHHQIKIKMRHFQNSSQTEN